MASAFTISPPSRSATARASADLPVPVGPMIAIGRPPRVPDARRNTRRRRAPRDDSSFADRGACPGQPGQHLVGDPADDRARQPGQRRGVTAGQRVVERGLHRAASRGRNRRAQAVSGCRRRRRRPARRPGRRRRRSRRAAACRGPSAASAPWSSEYTRTSTRACGSTCPRSQPVTNAHSGIRRGPPSDVG